MSLLSAILAASKTIGKLIGHKDIRRQIGKLKLGDVTRFAHLSIALEAACLSFSDKQVI
ncbi:MAG: hypothetical protein JNM39_04315 [Bdellovibrionaceae bacterium]|nr:hypothetical protein [Pseudobdellovibrionaceae bacterium]